MADPVEKYGKKKIIIAAVVAIVVIGLMIYFGNNTHLPYNE